MALLSIEGVAKEYNVRGKRVVALDAIDLNIEHGEFVTIAGPSAEPDRGPVSRELGTYSLASSEGHSATVSRGEGG